MGISNLFELHIYTMGSRSYARKVSTQGLAAGVKRQGY